MCDETSVVADKTGGQFSAAHIESQNHAHGTIRSWVRRDPDQNSCSTDAGLAKCEDGCRVSVQVITSTGRTDLAICEESSNSISSEAEANNLDVVIS